MRQFRGRAVATFAGVGVLHFVSFGGLLAGIIVAGDFGPPASTSLSIRFAEVGAFLLGLPLMPLMKLPPSAFGSTRWWGDDGNFIIGLAALNSMLWVTIVVIGWRRYLRHR